MTADQPIDQHICTRYVLVITVADSFVPINDDDLGDNNDVSQSCVQLVDCFQTCIWLPILRHRHFDTSPSRITFNFQYLFLKIW